MIDFELLIEECDKDIEKVLDELGVEYIRETGGWVCMRCCFHHGEKYSLKYKNKKFFCFTECRRSYSIIDVASNILNVNIYDASVWICEIMGFNCEVKDKPVLDKSVRDSQKLLSSYKKIKQKNKIEYTPVPQVILNDIEPYYCKYIADWGITEKTANEFGLGIARGGELESRIVFPIDAPNGDIITLTGRLPNAELLGLKKYHILGNSESRYTLYNISRATKYAKELGYIFVVEGMKSVMMMWQWGYKNVVAVIGSSLTKEQADLLLKLSVDVYVIGDNDEAGKNMMQSTYNRLYSYLSVTMLDISKVTDIHKASVDDISKGQFEKLLEDTHLLEEVDW